MVDQVGGTHYSAEYQHWDWVADIALGYYGATATKYITRHHKKNGRQDIEKALSYVQKMRELPIKKWGGIPCLTSGHDKVLAHTLQLANNIALPEKEHRMCIWIATAVDHDDLIEVEAELEQMLSDMPHNTEQANMNAYYREGDLAYEMVGGGRVRYPPNLDED